MTAAARHDPSHTIDSRAAAEALGGMSARGVVEAWLTSTPAGVAALVVVLGEDAARDERVRRQLALADVRRVAFVPADFAVVVPRAVRVVPDPPPDNSEAAALARGFALLRDMERAGVDPASLDAEPTALTPEEEAEELRKLGL